MAAALLSRFRRDEPDAEPGDDEGAAGDAGDVEGEWLEYDFHEWSLEGRVMLAQLLKVDEVVHSWQGTTLLVHESFEEAVDSLVDEVTETEEAKEAISRPISPDEELTAFDLAPWSEELRQELVELLVQARVPHIIDRGASDAGDSSDSLPDDGGVEDSGAEVCDLLVREADEERVDLVIDDLLAREEEAQFAELDGLELHDLLGGLFMACDRLRREPVDLEGQRNAAICARTIAGVRTPFGFSAADWRTLRSAAGDLLELVENPETDPDEVQVSAHQMSDQLRRLI